MSLGVGTLAEVGCCLDGASLRAAFGLLFLQSYNI